MLMAGPATGDMHTRDAEAKRASENTAMAARKAVEQGQPSSRRAKFVPVTSQEPEVPKPIVQPPRRLPLSDYETKAEQARLLTLLRTIPPVDVVNQICKALAYFGGTPDAPPPADGNFPFSEKANGPGKFFVGWISEIFPYVPNLAIGAPAGLTHSHVAPVQPAPMQAPPTHIASTQAPSVPAHSVQAPPSYAHPVQANQAQATPAEISQQPKAPPPPSSGKRPRGRPKGSGSSKSRQNKVQTTGPGLLHNADAETVQGNVGDDSWIDVEDNETGMAAAQTSGAGPSVVGVSAPRSALAASSNTVGSVRRRGRPKGSKNRPKETRAVSNPSAVNTDTGSHASQPVQYAHVAPPSQEPHSTQPSYDGQGRAAQPLQSQEAAQPAANVSSFTPVNHTNQTPVAPLSAAPVTAAPDTSTPSKKRAGRPKGSKTKTKPDAVKPPTAITNHSQPAATAMSTPPPQPITMQQGHVTHSQLSQKQLNEHPISQGKVALSVDAHARAREIPDSSSQKVTASSSTWGAPPPPAKSSQGSRGKQNHSQGQSSHKQAQSLQNSSATAPPSAPKPLAANPNQSVTPASQPERQKRKYTKRKSKEISSASSTTASHSQPTRQPAPQATTDIGSSGGQGTSLTQQDPTVQQPAEPKVDDSPAARPAKKARRTKKPKPEVQPVVLQNGPSSGTDVPVIAPSPSAATNMISGAVGSVDSQVQRSSRSAAHDDLSLEDIHGLPHGHFGVQSPTMENYEAQLQAQLDQESEPQLQLLQDAIRDDKDESRNPSSDSHQIEQQPRQSQQTQQQSHDQYHHQQQAEQTTWLYQQRAQQPQQQPLRQQAARQAGQTLQKQSTSTTSQNRTSLPQQHGSISQSQSASPAATQATASATPTSQSLYRATGYQVNPKQTYSPQQTGQQQSSSWQQNAQNAQNAEAPTPNTQSQQYSAADQQPQRQQPSQYPSNQQTFSGGQAQWTATQQQRASGQQRYQPQAAATAATTSYDANTNQQPLTFSSGFSSSASYRSSPTGIISPFSGNRRLQSGNSSMSTPTSYRTSSAQSLGQAQNRTSSMDSLSPGMNPYQQQQHQRTSSANMTTANPQQGMGMGLGAASMPSFSTNSQTADWNLFGGSNAGQQHPTSNDMNLGTTSSYGVNNRTPSFPAAGMPSSTSVYGQASLSGYDASGVLGRQGGYYGNR